MKPHNHQTSELTLDQLQIFVVFPGGQEEEVLMAANLDLLFNLQFKFRGYLLNVFPTANGKDNVTGCLRRSNPVSKAER